MLNRVEREQRCTVEWAGGEGNVFRAAVEAKEGQSEWRLREDEGHVDDKRACEL